MDGDLSVLALLHVREAERLIFQRPDSNQTVLLALDTQLIPDAVLDRATHRSTIKRTVFEACRALLIRRASSTSSVSEPTASLNQEMGVFISHRLMFGRVRSVAITFEAHPSYIVLSGKSVAN